MTGPRFKLAVVDRANVDEEGFVRFEITQTADGEVVTLSVDPETFDAKCTCEEFKKKGKAVDGNRACAHHGAFKVTILPYLQIARSRARRQSC